jgi:hypothetical protein
LQFPSQRRQPSLDISNTHLRLIPHGLIGYWRKQLVRKLIHLQLKRRLLILKLANTRPCPLEFVSETLFRSRRRGLRCSGAAGWGRFCGPRRFG